MVVCGVHLCGNYCKYPFGFWFWLGLLQSNAACCRGSRKTEVRAGFFLIFKVLFCPLGLLFTEMPTATGGAAGGTLESLDCQLSYIRKARSLPPDWLNNINRLHSIHSDRQSNWFEVKKKKKCHGFFPLLLGDTWWIAVHCTQQSEKPTIILLF